MQNNVLKMLTKHGHELYLLRKVMDETEEKYQKDMSVMRERKEHLQAGMIVGFKSLELSSIKLPSGDTVALGTRPGLEVVSEPHALKWASLHGCVSINRTLVATKLKGIKKAPPGFKLVEREYISVRKPKAKTEK